MKKDLAMGYEKMAQELQEYIRNYKPDFWTVSICNVAYTPIISSNDFEIFAKEYVNGSLKQFLASSSIRQFSPWYVKEAIVNFFNEKYSEI